MNINCFIINLERCPEKRYRMIERMKKFPEINYELYEAIDGQELTEEYMNKNNYKMLNAWKDPFHGRKTTKGEIGCTLSHYNIYKKSMEMKNDITLILEDDAEFSVNFLSELKETINNLENQKWDMCYLGRKKVEINEPEEIINDILLYPSYSYWTLYYRLKFDFVKKRFYDTVKNFIH